MTDEIDVRSEWSEHFKKLHNIDKNDKKKMNVYVFDDARRKSYFEDMVIIRE